ncbi:innexin domain-containing protein [Ditylenchus destructor]|uniref:Innexin n=1 Tax=Ditylenchus destructor TaxID=166010 RepID=A0AAD4ND13_9BILA|nr:innexin domain-containing protein [Ditylenchus destructor]
MVLLEITPPPTPQSLMDAKLRTLINKVKKEHDDDAVDRAIYATTVYILAFFAILIMAKQYVGEPLQCWMPAEYTGAWEKYIENYCFVENTYFVNGTTNIPENRQMRKEYELRYYQWIPYILSLQAVLCFAPKLIFKVLYSFSDLRVTDLVQLAYRETKSKFSQNSKVSKMIAMRLVVKKNTKVVIAFNWYLTAIYFLMKLLLICVIVVQLVIMNYFVASADVVWGFTILWQLSQGLDWRSNGFFPRVTYCDLQTRDIGQIRQHTVQCVLMINMFAEKIFIFMWLWFFCFLVIAQLNLLFWLYRSLAMRSKVRMVVDALKLHNVHPNRATVENFIRSFLKYDGVVVLRLIDSNAGYVQMAEVLYQLWVNFYGLPTAAKTISMPLSSATRNDADPLLRKMPLEDDITKI